MMPPVTKPASRSPSTPSDNDVFSISTSLVPEQTHKTAGTTNLDFDGLLSKPLVLHEDLQEGCGGQLWPAGMTLAKYLLQNRALWQDKHIMEIGAGGGLVGLALAVASPIKEQVLITDQQPMLSLMRKNIQLNNLSPHVSAQVYDWGSKPAPAFPTPTRLPDVLLAADCVYFEPAFPLLLETLNDLIGPSTKCYFCFKKRRKADMRFIRDMTKRFSVTEIDYADKEHDKKAGIHLYQVVKRGKVPA